MTIALNSNLPASYNQISAIDDIDAIDKCMVEFAYSKPLYKNVGLVFNYPRYGSVVYIGGKMCLTATHCLFNNSFNKQLMVGFEIDSSTMTYFKVEHFITHSNVDLTLLILDKPVNGLSGLKINYEFLNEKQILTHIGYGIKIFANNWLCTTDFKRRASQLYPINLPTDSEPDIYTTSHKKYTTNKIVKTLIRSGMSGGGTINEKGELMAIMIKTTIDYPTFYSTIYSYFAYAVNGISSIINRYGFALPFLLTNVTQASACSTLLGPLKEWIEQVRREYDDIYDIV